jgi:hypothetical protein
MEGSSSVAINEPGGASSSAAGLNGNQRQSTNLDLLLSETLACKAAHQWQSKNLDLLLSETLACKAAHQ